MNWWMRLAAAALLIAGASAQAGEFNSVLKPGDAAPAWKDLPGVDGEKHSLSEIKTPIVVVAFTCNSCPYAKDYEDRLIALTQKYGGDAPQATVVAINVNNHEADRLPAMIERANVKGFNFGYLYDESQQIARDYGATRTPEFFVLNADRKVVYQGAFDDHTDPAKVNNRWVDKAIIALLAGGAPEKQETLTIGCAIKFETDRDREIRIKKEQKDKQK